MMKKNISSEDILVFLDRCGANYKLFKIDTNLNEKQISKLIGVSYSQEAKSLLLIKDGDPCLLIVSRLNKIDFKKIKEFTKAKKIEMAKPMEVKEITGLEIGSIPPFGCLINIPVYLDKTLSQERKIAFNGGVKEIIISMSMSDCVRIISPKIGDYIKE